MFLTDGVSSTIATINRIRATIGVLYLFWVKIGALHLSLDKIFPTDGVSSTIANEEPPNINHYITVRQDSCREELRLRQQHVRNYCQLVCVGVS